MGGISHAHFNMTQRIAPNNNLPATHFIEVWKGVTKTLQTLSPNYISRLEEVIDKRTIAIFKIRKNKLPTIHNF